MYAGVRNYMNKNVIVALDSVFHSLHWSVATMSGVVSSLQWNTNNCASVQPAEHAVSVE